MGPETVRKILQDKAIPVTDEFICQGGFLLYKVGHPNKNGIQEAVAFAVRMSEGIKD